MIRILPAVPQDAAAIASLEAVCFAGLDPWGEEAVAATLSSPVGNCFLAKDGETPVGYLLGTFIAPEGEIDRVGVLPAYRRQGIGKALLVPFCERAETVFLDVRASNLPAQALYRACGFTVCGKRSGFYRATAAHPVEDAVLMSRQKSDSEKEV